MKSLFLIFSLIASPIALAQADPAVPQAQVAAPITDQFTAANVRPDKVATFQNRAADINRRIKVLEEEAKKINERANSKFYKNIEKFDKFRREAERHSDKIFQPTGPPRDPDHEKRVIEIQREVRDFRREIATEFNLRQKELGGYAKAKQDQLKAHQQKIAEQGATLAPSHEAASRRQKETPHSPAAVTEAVPSSVPGLPPGVEPAKKKQTALPPGMTKGK